MWVIWLFATNSLLYDILKNCEADRIKYTFITTASILRESSSAASQALVQNGQIKEESN